MSSLMIKADELLQAEVDFLEGEIATLQKRRDDLRDLMTTKSPAPIPKAGPSTRSSSTSGRTQPAGPASMSEPQRAIRAAADKVRWTVKNEGWAWAFVFERDGNQVESAKELAGMIRTSAEHEVSDGEFVYKIGGEGGKFLNRTKVGSK